jgi:hypothetical protein
MPEDRLRDFWSCPLVTDGPVFWGSGVVEKLRQRQCGEILVPRSEKFDLRKTEDIARFF